MQVFHTQQRQIISNITSEKKEVIQWTNSTTKEKSHDNVLEDVLVFHKIQKTGSTTFDFIIRKFSEKKSYSFRGFPSGKRSMNNAEQVRWIMNTVQ